MPDTLPDSRLVLDPSLGTVMVDWPLPGGGSTRLEAQPIYCANCGKLYGYVPKDNTSFAFWLCRKCFETYGEIAGMLAVPEEEFNQAVEFEMQERFGRGLSAEEIALIKEDGRLGHALELLEKESPYPNPT